MVDINIKSGQGISQALAEYAKELNGGKALKINAKQWQSIMTTINDINSNRESHETIFTGNGNIFGSSKNNFVVNEGKMTFSNEEMSLILNQMGLNQDLIKKEFANDMQIKGLSIERSADKPAASQPQSNPASVSAEEPTPAPVISEGLKTQTPPPAPTRPAFNFSSAQSPFTSQTKIDIPVTAAATPAPTAPAEEEPTSVEQLQPQADNTAAEELSPQTAAQLNILQSAKPSEVSRTEMARVQTTIDEQETAKSGNNDISFLDDAENLKFYKDGTIKSLDLKIDDLDWAKKGRAKWNKEHQLVTKDLDNMMVKNADGKTIANYHEGKYYIGAKEVSYDKFQKFAAKKGDVITMNYKPNFQTLDSKASMTSVLRSQVQANLDSLLSEKITPAVQDIATQQTPKQYTQKVLTPEFYNRVKDIAEKINCKPEDLLAVMNSESGLTTTAKNHHTGATGLIQFMPQTARSLGTSVNELAKMTPLQQLDYVEKFLISAKRSYIKSDRALSAGDLYGLIFMPAKSGQDVLAVKGSKTYRQNRGLDYDGDGVISRKDLEAHVNTKQVDVKFKNA